ncbi:hypothetical protein [Gilliamella sp. Pas-s27]|uniref:hypothetical protein n=1 Tax=Gilliamella sp. Pas-s27 TaxID=2687311 RepID=UPI001365C97F|nr:hypothetical protein [Gilliamella sp. Pas-s27]MWP47534.1 hypothetical protein [Gilliamella sp. Pas-s27]
MINKIYLLESDTRNYSIFIQDWDPDKTESIMGIAMDQKWKSFKNYEPIKLELYRSDTGKKNYKLDFSGFLGPFYICSQLTLEKLKDILPVKGQILPVITDSKRKQFFGYYPTNPLSGCLDKEKSIYREAERGLIIEKPVLIADKITEEYIFSIEEDISRVFVTDKFKQRVEEAGLLAFDFSREIELS